ncbi:MAG: hypothetical protein R3254_05655, partial [Thiomicrorhabdus sp.]|nr:hypothetical protein [Thiomicrorhabdus sp.]
AQQGPERARHPLPARERRQAWVLRGALFQQQRGVDDHDDKNIQQATEKMQEINAAYEEIKRRKGV